ncbi:TetR/AcrR family transcriptional regulator [Paenarthrobacter nicotinovorans]|uniref:TetR/AcrR family transcriptional regulator n=1 Tax=Paenarthrobacter TaxID=1742992 RepID=UPI003DA2ED64
MAYGAGRDALVRAAIEIVAEKGIQGLTHRSVAARAGVNHGLVALHFGSLDGLVAAATESAVERAITETGLARAEGFDGSFADQLLASLVSDPEIEMFQARMVLEARGRPEIRALIERLYENYISTIERGLRGRGIHGNEGSPKELARLVFASLNGLVLQFLAVGSEAPIREAIVELGRLLDAVSPTRNRPEAPAARHRP